ncbi:MAG TPA: molybdopterin-dependent oxidoreductase [Nocardioides sp.]|nr:molybdopterin-dependent oxidoreductase [Nocardioides sp.]
MKVPTFSSRLRSPAVAARLGVWVGICFGVCFVTGLISHYAQLPQQPVAFPTSPSWGYRLTQTLHVVSGTAAIPLLLLKLWAVYPRLFQALPRRLGEVVLSALERGSIAVLVAGSLLELGIGVMNVAQWYLWRFDFRATHYALAWAVIGALLVHVAVKLPVIRDALTSDVDSIGADRPEAVAAGVVGRRAVIRTGWLAAAVAVVTASSAAGTVPGLDRLAVLSPRSRRSGIPVNRTAADARVAPAALGVGYRCRVEHAGGSAAFTRADLLALPQSTHTLAIACVEGWSADGSWTGVPLREVLDRVGAPRGRAVVVTSLEPQGPERVSTLPADFADDPRTLLALALDGEPLSLDHGYPVRLIAPDRPGALQTKWIARIEVL